MQTLNDLKKQLRREKIAARRQLTPEIRHSADRAINQRVLALLKCHHGPVAAYVSDGTEPDLQESLRVILECGRPLFLPRFASDGSYDMVLCTGLTFSMEHWGIPEPGPDAPCADPKDLRKSLWLVPGVAFDETCMRLGRGKGIYDRLLAEENAGSAGIFYECQKCAGIPAASHDRALDLVVTEQSFYAAPGGTIPECFRELL